MSKNQTENFECANDENDDGLLSLSTIPVCGRQLLSHRQLIIHIISISFGDSSNASIISCIEIR